MNPTQQPQPAKTPEEIEQDAKYAASLLQMVSMQEKMKQSEQPKKRRISNKRLIYVGISVALTIASIVTGSLTFGSRTPDTSTDTSKQVIDDLNYVKDISK